MPVGNEMALLARPVNLAKDWKVLLANDLGFFRVAWLAVNAVRFRVKPGREQEFLDAHKKVERNWAGLQHVNIIKTGDRTYCIIAEWTDMDALAAALDGGPTAGATLNLLQEALQDRKSVV